MYFVQIYEIFANLFVLINVRGTPSEPSQTTSDPCPSSAAARPISATAADHYLSLATARPIGATAADHYLSLAAARPLSPTARPFVPRTRRRSHSSPSADI